MPSGRPFDPACPFCRIGAGDQEARIVRETDDLVAFRDSNPQAPTHILLIPKEHIASLAGVEDRHGPLLTHLIQAAAELAMDEGIDRSGWRVVANTGADAGQSVHHLHLHLLGGRRMAWPPG
jgi:histidine triad (HIT) family protein